MTPLESYQRAIVELLGREPRGPEDMIAAARLAAEKQRVTHRIYHADAQRAGAVVWAMREQKMTWREIYDTSGIIQRTGARWLKLFLDEGIAAQPAADLDARRQGPSV